MDKGLNRLFPSKDKQIADRHVKRCSTSLVPQETRLETTERYYPTVISMLEC